jgi:hypothetical protein
MVVSLEVVELVLFESLIDVILFNIVSYHFQALFEVHDTNIIIGLCNIDPSVVVRLDIVYSFDFSNFKIHLEAHVFSEFS